MRPIPGALRAKMERHPDYRKGYCIYHQSMHPPDIKTQWHHNLIFGGRQVNEQWAILQICKIVHALANEKSVRERLDWIMLNRATDEQLKKYSKATDLVAERERLNKIYE